MEVKKLHEYNAADLDCVRIERADRRKWNFGGYRDKSFNRILVDGEHVGFLAMEAGWRKPWRILDLSEADLGASRYSDKESCRADVCALFARGQLMTAAQAEVHRAEAERQRQENQASADRRRAERLRAEEDRLRKFEKDRATAERAIALLDDLAAGAGDDLDLLAFAARTLREKYQVS